MKEISVSVDDKTLEKLDELADQEGSRSAAVRKLASQTNAESLEEIGKQIAEERNREPEGRVPREWQEAGV